jgi:Zn-dependent M28 family amino/carboxypeptidase
MIPFERSWLPTVPLLLLSAVVRAADGMPPADSPPAAIDRMEFERHLARIASDEFDGRKPGTRGERLTVGYLVEQFRHLGLHPGNGTSFLQEVPLVEITAAPDASLRLGSQSLHYPDEAVFWTRRVQPRSGLADSPLVFVGHGVVAPEYGWNDYAGIDMHGKTAVILVNDPGFATGDPDLFRGRAMTYYGRWTYKFEEAARQGASGALIVHETEAAAYPWHTVESSNTGPQLSTSTADGNAGRSAIEGWIPIEIAQRLFTEAGLDYVQQRLAASRRGFRPLDMHLTASASVHNSIRRTRTTNVVATIPGKFAPGDYVIYSAHWDHLGHAATAVAGDAIYNGAEDNGTGVAGLLALAAAFERAGAPPHRTVVFFAPTAEESGLLGTEYYVQHPLFPLARTVADINMDTLNFGAPTRDISVVGAGASELDRVLARAAALQGRVPAPEPTPEKGFFYRSDNFNFAKAGVPALYVKTGVDDRELGRAGGSARLDEYYAKRYHQPADEYRPGVDLRGPVETLDLLYLVGRDLAMGTDFPEWSVDSEFRAVRARSRPKPAAR